MIAPGICFLTATKSHKRVQAMTYAQAELLVNVDPEIRSNSLPSGVEPPEGKKKGKCGPPELAAKIRLYCIDNL